MLAAAHMYADAQDAIPECAAFADAGGFAFELPEHHLIIANAGGLYVEIETASDPHYDSTGINRVHVNTCGVGARGTCVATHPALTPTAGPPQENGGISFGPWWATTADIPGTRDSLANATYAGVAGVAFVPAWDSSASDVSFSVEYFLVAQGLVATQTFALSVAPGTGAAPSLAVVSQVELVGGAVALARAAARGVAVSEAHLARARAPGGALAPGAMLANLTRFGLQIPAFAFDGAVNTTTSIDAAASSVTVAGPSAWGSATWTVDPAKGSSPVTIERGNGTTVTRNGLMDCVWVETVFGTRAPSLRATLTVEGGTM